MSDYLLKLPDETHLSYSLVQDVMNQGLKPFEWFRSYPSNNLQNRTYTRKDNAPRIGFWTARGPIKLVVADFDTLPKGFTRWTKFAEYLKENYSEWYVWRTQSRKVKMVRAFELSNSYINTKMARFILEKNLEPKLFKAVDKNMWAMATSYTHPLMVEGLVKYLKSMTVKKMDMTEYYYAPSGHKWKSHDGKIPRAFEKAFCKGDERKRKFVRILMRQKQLAMKDGLDLPTPKIARECGVSQRTASTWRGMLEDLHLLKCICESYQKGKKAKTFKAIGWLKQLIKGIFQAPVRSERVYRDLHLPTSIDDGHWHENLWKTSKYFLRDPRAFLDWAVTLEGVNDRGKGRLGMATRAIKSRLKYAGLLQNHSFLT